MCECDRLFEQFESLPLGAIDSDNIPAGKGVYALRLVTRGEDISLDTLEMKVHKLNVRYVTSNIWPWAKDRLTRVLRQVDTCPILYVGATGLRPYGRADFAMRWESMFSGKHVILPAFWILIIHRWKMDYLYRVMSEPKHLEDKILADYFKIHSCLPPLNRPIVMKVI